MARDEHDREDLFAEASGLAPRAELELAADQSPVVLGLHRGGGLSLYFGPEEAWHFNPQGELRRAYLAGRLYKAEERRLIALDRERTADAVHLAREDLAAQTVESLLGGLAARLRSLRNALASGEARQLRCFPDSPASLADLRRVLDSLPQTIALARRPNAAG